MPRERRRKATLAASANLLVMVLGSVALLVMVASTLLAVVTRYFEVLGYEWSYEVAGIAFIWVTFLGALLAETRHENAAFELLRSGSTPLLRRGLELLEIIVLGGLGSVLLASSIAMLKRSAFIPSSLLRLPGYVVGGAAPALGLGLLVLAIVRLLRLHRARQGSCA